MWSKMRTKRERLALLSKVNRLGDTAWLFRHFSSDQFFCSLHCCVLNGEFSESSCTNRSHWWAVVLRGVVRNIWRFSDTVERFTWRQDFGRILLQYTVNNGST